MKRYTETCRRKKMCSTRIRTKWWNNGAMCNEVVFQLSKPRKAFEKLFYEFGLPSLRGEFILSFYLWKTFRNAEWVCWNLIEVNFLWGRSEMLPYLILLCVIWNGALSWGVGSKELEKMWSLMPEGGRGGKGDGAVGHFWKFLFEILIGEMSKTTLS